MIRIGVIGRNVPGKGIDIVKKLLNFDPDLDAVFILFTDMFDINSNLYNRKILNKGWQDRDVVWSEKFDVLLLPMTAPETYSYVLHESVLRNLPLIVNENNASLKTQLEFAYYYKDIKDLVLLIRRLSENNEALIPAITKQTRNIWNRLI